MKIEFFDLSWIFLNKRFQITNLSTHSCHVQHGATFVEPLWGSNPGFQLHNLFSKIISKESPIWTPGTQVYFILLETSVPTSPLPAKIATRPLKIFMLSNNILNQVKRHGPFDSACHLCWSISYHAVPYCTTLHLQNVSKIGCGFAKMWSSHVRHFKWKWVYGACSSSGKEMFSHQQIWKS